MLQKLIISLVLIIFSCTIIEASLRRCYQCRSRGELGTCKDPFKYNVTLIEDERGILAVPCASGWCGKVIEGGHGLKQDDYDMATQRMCVQRGPSDSEDRCAFTVYNYKKVFMCFCQGDLCNSSTKIELNGFTLFLLTILSIFVLNQQLQT